MTIITVNSPSELDSQIKDAGDKWIVIMFTSPSCSACRYIYPTVTQLAKDYENKLKFIRVDINQNSELAHRYHIHMLPTFQFIHLGRTVDKLCGSDAKALGDKIKSVLKLKK